MEKAIKITMTKVFNKNIKEEGGSNGKIRLSNKNIKF